MALFLPGHLYVYIHRDSKSPRMLRSAGSDVRLFSYHIVQTQPITQSYIPHPFIQRPFTLLPTLHLHPLAVVRRPDASDGLVGALDGLGHAADLVAAGVAEDLGLLEDLERLHVAHADGALAAVDVLRYDDGVLGRAGRDGELDLRVGGGELGEEGLDEAAGGQSVSRIVDYWMD